MGKQKIETKTKFRAKLKAETIKYAAILATCVVSVAVIVLVTPVFTSDFRGEKIVNLNFSSEANLEQVVEKTNSIGDYDRIEKLNAFQVIINFAQLDENEEALTTRYIELEGFSSLNIEEVNAVPRNYDGIRAFAIFAIPLFLGLQYLFLSNIEKSRDKTALLFAFLVQNTLAGVVFVSILFNLSQIYPISTEILNIFLSLVVGRILIDVILLFKVNFAAIGESQENFPMFVKKFVFKFDVNFVIVSLFSTIVFLPLILVSAEPVATGIILISFVGLNILLETFVFADLVSFFNFSIRTIPVIRRLKWSRK